MSTYFWLCVWVEPVVLMMELSLRKSGESAHTLQILQTEKHKRGQAGKYYPGGRNITILLVSQTLQYCKHCRLRLGNIWVDKTGKYCCHLSKAAVERKIALFPTIKQKKLQISIRIGGLCIHSRCKHHRMLFSFTKENQTDVLRLCIFVHSHVQAWEITRGKVFSFFLCRQQNL